ncbi:DNA-binding transcriptional regulator, MerR family [Streptoalloteichus tenebrarius]|uniref:DNA-binding transcriptional regulator, MerR family n=1 Tax=Streptoalloteichus tenebrarius (strain ATCC 17920 / DSM 40477 / JCM 4838 / CBS 697.72 / NBRC 16177 / NCIMB 11028 / NRRL B-12390 / A12253. 1 / ISP 5477) TaxID=1933 RepID=A0ABT1HY76_STRSD|nr:MerR family transcriptional regulator [Streptoalloteichus tenebrarius]MCP2260468.1 DNA-binding transcriptional regulator, MerR family [Streptoalloteichus tenebrarius]BFF02736.1 MerR family transcriptional regulator [Streptoalloteichus tenebrarius]
MTYSIAQAAERTGLSVDTLRYYERIGLLEPPARDSGGRRVYSDADLTWLDFLTKLRLTGMPIRMMREYAQLRYRGVMTAGRRKQLLVEHRADVLERIAELRSCLDVLNYKIDNYDQILRDQAARERAAATPEEATA